MMVFIAQFPYLELFGLGGLGVSALCQSSIHRGSSPLGTAGSRSSQVLVSLVICVFSLFFLQISTDYLILEQENIAEDAGENKMMWNAKWGGEKKNHGKFPKRSQGSPWLGKKEAPIGKIENGLDCSLPGWITGANLIIARNLLTVSPIVFRMVIKGFSGFSVKTNAKNQNPYSLLPSMIFHGF